MVEQSPPKSRKHDAGIWILNVTEHHILKSLGSEREDFERKLELPALPEMIFDKNSVSISLSGIPVESTSCISFNSLDALKLVDSKNVEVEVPIAKVWREARTEQEEVVLHKPYDWTFTTPYCGTISGPWTIVPHPNGLDMDHLLRRDPIEFFVDTTLYEDELGDNGISLLNVKLRAMKSGFFLLQRFFLRVDGGFVRIFDTRIQWRTGDDYLVRDIKRMQSSAWTPSMNNVDILTADQYCDKLLEHRSEKLIPDLGKRTDAE